MTIIFKVLIIATINELFRGSANYTFRVQQIVRDLQSVIFVNFSKYFFLNLIENMNLKE